MARSSTSPKAPRPEDLHDGLVERLRRGEPISTEKIPSHRLATAAARLRKEGVEVVTEKVVTNPGTFPAMVRSVYRVPSAAPATNGKVAKLEEDRKTWTPPISKRPPAKRKPPQGSVSAEVRQRLIDGDTLTAAQVADEYGVSGSILGQAAQVLRDMGYLVDAKRQNGGGPAVYSCSTKPMGRRSAPKPKRPKWVEEAEEEEAAEIVEPMLAPVPSNGQRPRRHPALGSKVCAVEEDEHGVLRVKIRDGEEVFTATLH